MWVYLDIAGLALGFIPVVSQGGKCHSFNQLLELVITGYKVGLTVNLHENRRNTFC